MDYGKIAYMKVQDLSRRMDLSRRTTENRRVVVNVPEVEIGAGGAIGMSLYAATKTEWTGLLFVTASQAATATVLVDGVRLTELKLTAGVPTVYAATADAEGISTVTVAFDNEAPMQVSAAWVAEGKDLLKDALKPILAASKTHRMCIVGTEAVLYDEELNEVDTWTLPETVTGASLVTVQGKPTLFYVAKNQLFCFDGTEARLLFGNVTAVETLEEDTVTVFFLSGNRVYTLTDADGFSEKTELRLQSGERLVSLSACADGGDRYLLAECNGRSFLFADQGEGYVSVKRLNVTGVRGIAVRGSDFAVALYDGKRAIRLDGSLVTDNVTLRPLCYAEDARMCGFDLMIRAQRLFIWEAPK